MSQCIDLLSVILGCGGCFRYGISLKINYKWQFSIARLVYQRVDWHTMKPRALLHVSGLDITLENRLFSKTFNKVILMAFRSDLVAFRSWKMPLMLHYHDDWDWLLLPCGTILAILCILPVHSFNAFFQCILPVHSSSSVAKWCLKHLTLTQEFAKYKG